MNDTKPQRCGQKRRVGDAGAGYSRRHTRHMRDDESLRRAWPMASGVVEGTCKHLVQDRMERLGMRWTQTLAEAMPRLRAVSLRGDFDASWKFLVARDHERLHPPRLL